MLLWNYLTKETQDQRLALQTLLEEDMLGCSTKKYWETYDIHPDEGIPEQSLLESCVKTLGPCYQSWIDTVAGNPRTPSWVYPLFAIGSNKMADVVIRSLILEWFTSSLWDRKHEGETFVLPSAQRLAYTISNMVIDIISYQEIKKVKKGDWLKQSHYQKNWTPKRCIAFTKKMGGISKKDFTRKQRQDFGHNILRIAEASGIIRLINIKTKKGNRWYERVVVAFSDEVLQELNNKHSDILSIASLLYRPMIVPPVAHTKDHSGGNLLSFVRKPVVQKFRDVLWDEEPVNKGSIASEIVIDGLNCLMHTEWGINHKIFSVMETLFKSNTRLANLPAYDFNSFDFSTPFPKDGSKEEKIKWKTTKEEAYSNWFKEERSRGRMLIRMKLAKDMVKYGFFYQVYTCDFRGRANSACDLLSPQSSDFDRSLIWFATPVKQTVQGIYWLKIHLANLFDQDNLPFDQRIKWVEDNIVILKAINNNPYDNKSFWVSNKVKKNPSFQRLAAIFELFRLDGLTQLPIQMDGSCNGVQHWVALTKDETLASEVNLTKTDKPGDLYNLVATMVTDTMMGIKDSTSKAGLWAKQFLEYWKNKIPRSVCKRAVMTDPYGVTLFGIRRYCITEGHLSWISKEFLAGAARELSTLIDQTMKKVLIKPNKSKIWLKQIADIVSKKQEFLEWVTPCGFKVVHQYYEIKLRRSISKLFNIKELYFGNYDPHTIDKYAINLAIAPNYIHSLDASHMWCTIRRMMLVNIHSYSMIHDSYGCHAPLVDVMRTYTLEEFHRMHKNNLLEEFKKQIETKYSLVLPELPTTGVYNVDNILQSSYMFH